MFQTMLKINIVFLDFTKTLFGEKHRFKNDQHRLFDFSEKRYNVIILLSRDIFWGADGAILGF